jgi:LmbE family N-acetylglucosaminyl deacetylase
VEPLVGLTSADDLAAARDRLASIVAAELAALRPSLVLAPGLADGHHAHEIVAAAVADAVQLGGLPVTVWSWELWGQLRTPTLLVRVDHALDRVCAALAAHASQVARNDYFRLVRSRAAVASILGPERVFGFGQAGVAYAAAEILSETVYSDGTWRLGAPRELNVIDPTVTPGGGTDRA